MQEVPPCSDLAATVRHWPRYRWLLVGSLVAMVVSLFLPLARSLGRRWRVGAGSARRALTEAPERALARVIRRSPNDVRRVRRILDYGAALTALLVVSSTAVGIPSVASAS